MAVCPTALYQSVDGLRWTAAKLKPGHGSQLSGATGDERGLFVGNQYGVLISRDGLSWTQHEISASIGAVDEVALTNLGLLATTTFQEAWLSEYDYRDHHVWKGIDPTPGGNPIDADGSLIVDENGSLYQLVSGDEPGFIATDLYAVEGQADVMVSLYRFGSASQALTIAISTDGTAVAGVDYTPIPQTLVFPAGQSHMSFPVALINDETKEPEKVLVIRFPDYEKSMNLHLRDDDGVPDVTLSTEDYTAVESPETLGLGMVVALNKAALTPVSVSLTYTGTALPGTDYSGAVEEVTFLPGEMLKTLHWSLVDDTVAESEETLTVTLSTAIGADVGTSSELNITVADRDLGGAPFQSWSVSHVSKPGGPSALPKVPGGTQGDWLQLVQGNGRWLGIVDSRLLASDDGEFWHEVKVGWPAMAPSHLAFGNGRFLLIGYPTSSSAIFLGTPYLATSVDGLTWTQPSAKHFNRVVWDGFKFVGLLGPDFGSGSSDGSREPLSLHFSRDGDSWSLSKPTGLKLADDFVDLAAAGGRLFMLSDKGMIYESSDGGQRWKRVVLPGGKRSSLTGQVAGHAGAIVILGSTPAVRVQRSAWKTISSPALRGCRTVVWLDGMFRAYDGIGRELRSTDGVVWNGEAEIPWNGEELHTVQASSEGFVATGRVYSGATALFPSGVQSWQAGQVKEGDYRSFQEVAVAPFAMMAVGNFAGHLSTDQGRTWKPVRLPLAEYRDVCWTGSQFVAVGRTYAREGRSYRAEAILCTSPDGITWTRRTVPTPIPLVAVDYSTSKLAALGETGEICLSEDGVLWNRAVVDSPDQALDFPPGSLVWIGQSFLAMSRQGVVLYADEDGADWRIRDAHVPALMSGKLSRVGASVLVGAENGRYHRSDDEGRTWTSHSMGVQGDVRSFAVNGPVVMAVTSDGVLQSGGAGWVLETELRIGSASEYPDEIDGVVRVPIYLSAPVTAEVDVPVIVEQVGTGPFAQPGADYIVPLSLKLRPGQLSATLEIRLIDDALQEESEELFVRLLQPHGGGVILTEDNRCQIVIYDDDAPAHVYDSNAGGLLADEGATMELLTFSESSPHLTIQWKKNGKLLPGQNEDILTVNNVTLADAGRYTCELRTHVGPPAIVTWDVAVVERVTKQLVPLAGRSVTVSQPLAGTGVELNWMFNGEQVEMDHPIATISADRKQLKLRPPFDACEVRCIITQFLTGAQASSEWTIVPVTNKPSLDEWHLSIGSPVGVVGSSFDLVLTSTEETPAERWSATGLPPGLVFDPQGRWIYGIPQKVGKYRVTVSAINGAGTTARSGMIEIVALPLDRIGKWEGLLEPDGNLETRTGGQLSVQITRDGTFTARLRSGPNRWSWKGPVITSESEESTMRSPVLRGKSGGSFWVQLAVDSDRRLRGSTIVVDETGTTVDSPSIYGWQRTERDPDLAGRFNFISSGPPGGWGYGHAKITATGDVTLAGILSDGTPFTSASVVGDNSFVIYSPLHGDKGGIVGRSDLQTDFEGNHAFQTTDMKWFRPAGLRDYPAGWDNGTCSLKGSHYRPPEPGMTPLGVPYIQGVTNGTASLAGGGVEALFPEEPIPFILNSSGALERYAPARDFYRSKLAIDVATGRFSGEFTQPPGSYNPWETPSVIRFKGVLFSPSWDEVGYEGYGQFFLPDPTAAVSSPRPKGQGEPMRSGSVVLTKYLKAL